MAAVETMTVLAGDPACTEAIRPRSSFRVLRSSDPAQVEGAANLIVMSSASGLVAVAPFVREANNRGRLRAVLVHQDVEPRWMVQMLERAGLRVLRNMLVHGDLAVPKRVLGAWRIGAQEQLVADASVVGDALMVVSCAMERLVVPFDAVPVLAGLSDTDRKDFEITDDGSYLHWSGPDIDLDFEALKVAIDPEARKRAREARLRHDERFGRAVAVVRKAHGLRQSDVEGLSTRQMRRIEAGAFPRSVTLEKIAAAHDLGLASYLDAVATAIQGIDPAV